MKAIFHTFVILATCFLSCKQVADVFPDSGPAARTATGFRVISHETQEPVVCRVDLRVLYTDEPTGFLTLVDLRENVADVSRFPTHPDWYEVWPNFFQEPRDRTYNYGMWALVEISFPDGIQKRGRNRYNVHHFVCPAEEVEDIGPIVTDTFRAGI